MLFRGQSKTAHLDYCIELEACEPESAIKTAQHAEPCQDLSFTAVGVASSTLLLQVVLEMPTTATTAVQNFYVCG